MNLFQIAHDNASSLEAQLEEHRQRLADGELDSFDRFAERIRIAALVSMNMRPWVLTEVVLNGHQNIYEWATEQSVLSGRPQREILNEKLTTWFERRLRFDTAFDDGEHFRYGALNVGGVGSTRYGNFCVVLKGAFLEGLTTLAYLKNDSLRCYFTHAGLVDDMRLRAEVALHEHRHYLAALKHASALSRGSDSEWAQMVCSDSEYIEAIFIGDVSMPEIEEVRVQRTEYERLWNLAFSDFGSSRKDEERALLNDFVVILRAAGNGQLKLKVE